MIHRILLILLAGTWVYGQAAGPETQSDGEDPFISAESAILDTGQVARGETRGEMDLLEIPEEQRGLDYGFKGYAWGSSIENLPQLPNMDTVYVDPSQVTVRLKGRLGQDTTEVTYAYSDSGFWKVEFNIQLDPRDIDAQVELFSSIERSITEIYGPPRSTNQVISGPSTAYANVMNIKYVRAFYRSTWKETPCQIELMLNGLVQVPATDLPIIDMNPSVLSLVYYNPDYMIIEVPPQEEKLPSIFDIY